MSYFFPSYQGWKWGKFMVSDIFATLIKSGFIIVDRALAIEWDHSVEREEIVRLTLQFWLCWNEVPGQIKNFLFSKGIIGHFHYFWPIFTGSLSTCVRHFWSTTAIADVRRLFVMSDGYFWCSTAISDIRRLFLMSDGYFWCSTAIADVRWLFLMSDGYFWYPTAISDVRWLFLMSDGYFWCPTAMSDVRRPFPPLLLFYYLVLFPH